MECPGALDQIHNSGRAVGVHTACPGIGIAVAEYVKHRIRMGGPPQFRRHLGNQNAGAKQEEGGLKTMHAG